MLVEDDKSLREIYGVRLLAEGYDIVSAGDGEEALAMAIKERPSLIVSDVMMPKISGFDMLDILRSTTETKNIKVIMMTALSSEEQRQRGESLGADRYLVKSQVGIEDVVRVVHEVLEDQPGTTPAAPVAPAAPSAASAMPTPTQIVVPPRPTAPEPVVPTPAASQIPVPGIPAPSAPAITTPPAPVAPAPTPAPAPPTTPKPSSIKTRIIAPLNDPSTQPVDINELLDKELAKEAGIAEDARPAIATTDQEKAIVDQQLTQFATPATPTPEIIPDPKHEPLAPEHIMAPGEVEISADGTINTGEPESSTAVPPPPPPPATGV